MLRVPRVIFNRNIPIKRGVATVQSQKDVSSEYNEVAEYPPIVDPCLIKRKERINLHYREKIKQIGTIEEKQLQINLPRYYGYKCLMLNDKIYPYNTLPFFQYATNTEFVEETTAPSSEEEDKKIGNFLSLIKAEIQDALEFELDGYKQSFEIKTSDVTKADINRAKTSGIVKQLNRTLINALAADNRHLHELDSDIDPRHEAFWFVGGIDPTKQVVRWREMRQSPLAKLPVDRPFQYVGKPFLALRHQLPLAPFEDIDFSAVTSPNERIPSVTVDSRTLGFATAHRHGTSIPGFWPGNVREYGLISFQDRNHINIRRNADYGDQDRLEALHSQGIVSSYAWLLAQACYQGFSTYNDMTYPLASQTVITDGQFWSFYKYQLNTTCAHTYTSDQPNYRYNKCWGTKELKLYDQVDDNGKVQGLNEDVLKHLIKFYINQPKAREHEMKPFLHPKEKKVADLEDVKQRDWLEKTFKLIMSNRPRHRLVPEIYSWEKHYKIDNNTRPLDRRLRFFQLEINPFRRKLNEHQPKYIPRHLRARGIHDKKRFDATYWPLDHRMNIPKERSHSQMGAPRTKFANLMDRKRKSYK